ncbi:MAG: hypothetical protein RSF40_11295 [Oscillospiraceae bacterium]
MASKKVRICIDHNKRKQLSSYANEICDKLNLPGKYEVKDEKELFLIINDPNGQKQKLIESDIELNQASIARFGCPVTELAEDEIKSPLFKRNCLSRYSFYTCLFTLIEAPEGKNADGWKQAFRYLSKKENTWAVDENKIAEDCSLYTTSEKQAEALKLLTDIYQYAQRDDIPRGTKIALKPISDGFSDKGFGLELETDWMCSELQAGWKK